MDEPIDMDLLRGCVENPEEWFRWSILADWFADRDDEVGEVWARWVGENKKRPYRNKHGKYEWIFQNASKTYKFHGIDHWLTERMKQIDNYEWIHGSNTISDTYLLLLKGWRSEKHRRPQKPSA